MSSQFSDSTASDFAARKTVDKANIVSFVAANGLDGIASKTFGEIANHVGLHDGGSTRVQQLLDELVDAGTIARDTAHSGLQQSQFRYKSA